MSMLLDSYNLSEKILANRVVMAPMTRSRAKNHTPDKSTAIYYAQRASAGLIISEGTQISRQAQGYLWTPGIYTEEQVMGWRGVTDMVHEANGVIFSQLWHTGRMSHVSLQENEQAPLSSVDGRASINWPVFAYDNEGHPGRVQASLARRMTVAEIHATTQDYVRAAENAIVAGFDGIEIHAASGYLLDQFINGALNNRADAYGGERVGNRLRFVLEVMDAVAEAIGSNRVGIRITPEGRIHDAAAYPSEHVTFVTLAAELSKRNLAYLHVLDMGMAPELLEDVRNAFHGTLIISGDYTQEKAQAAIDAGIADLVAFGRPYIANPDLVERFRNGWPLEVADRDIYYGGTDRGYTDFLPYRES